MSERSDTVTARGNHVTPVSPDMRQALRLEWQLARVRAAEAQLRCERAQLRLLLALVDD